MNKLFYVVPAMGIIGLLFTAVRSAWVSKQDAGNERMTEIAKYISEGAMAFLKAEYKILTYFVIIAGLLLGFMGYSNPKSSPAIAIAFVIGAVFSALAGFIEIWTLAGGPAVVCSMLSAKGKRIGDVFAGTMVISERAAKLPAPVPMPPALAWWAASLQLSGLRPEQAELARQFLTRANQLEPSFRDQMAYRICAEVVAQISPPPPFNAPPATG